MLDIPSRDGLASLTRAVNEVLPAPTLGLSRSLDTGEVGVFYATPHGLGQYVLPPASVIDPLLPGAEGVRQAGAETIHLNPSGAIEAHLLVGHVQQLVSVPVPRGATATRLWVGTTQSEPPTREQLNRLQAIAAQCSEMLSARLTTEREIEQLRRLELAAGLLPTLLHVLDVRDVFDRLSAVGHAALPHDMLMLVLFNEDLTSMTVYARTGRGDDLGRVFPHPYPRAITEAWDFDIIDDRATYPLERDRPPTQLGMRSSLRLPFRFEGRTIGGLAFHAREPNTYSSLDLPVGRRLADHVAVALSHHIQAQQLAEQARRHEELRARSQKSDLLDEILASVTDAGELRDVFDRISSAAQKVLPHDAFVLTVRSADGPHSRIYAKSPESAPARDIAKATTSAASDAGAEQDVITAPTQGFAAALRLPIRLDNELVARLWFLARTPGAYSASDAAIARRVADRVAVSLARDRGAALMKRADEATARAAKLEARVRALTEELDARTGYRRVVGESPPWRQVLTQAMQVAATDTTVLLLGESGTGKEVVARFVHRGSPRKNGPFVALNCAALPEQLLEAELFGYERGAYTGATQSKPGQLEQAAGGTLFLDEVGEMSLPAQAKFLRVLQEREFQRLGGTRVLRSDARIVAATNRDLPRAIANAHFREDLFYRLNVFAIRLPPLRDRRDDILPLSEAFLAEIGRGLGRPPGGISREARQLLIDYHWPGNVRELRNILERAAILCDGGLITPDYLALTVTPVPALATVASPAERPSRPPTPAAVVPPAPGGDLQSMERAMIEQALQTARYNKSKAAKALGLTRHQLYIRMRRYGFE